MRLPVWPQARPNGLENALQGSSDVQVLRGEGDADGDARPVVNEADSRGRETTQ